MMMITRMTQTQLLLLQHLSFLSGQHEFDGQEQLGQDGVDGIDGVLQELLLVDGQQPPPRTATVFFFLFSRFGGDPPPKTGAEVLSSESLS